MQDMPVGLHGVFPVLYGDVIHMAGGGTEAAYSQSTLHYRFTPSSAGESDAEPRVVVDDSSAAWAPSPSAPQAPSQSSALVHLPAWLEAHRPAWMSSVVVALIAIHLW